VFRKRVPQVHICDGSMVVEVDILASGVKFDM